MHAIVTELHSFPLVIMKVWGNILSSGHCIWDLTGTIIEQDDGKFIDNSGKILLSALLDTKS